MKICLHTDVLLLQHEVTKMNHKNKTPKNYWQGLVDRCQSFSGFVRIENYVSQF